MKLSKLVPVVATLVSLAMLSLGCAEQLDIYDPETGNSVYDGRYARVILHEGKTIAVDAESDTPHSDAPPEKIEGLVPDDPTVVSVKIGSDEKGGRVFELTAHRVGRTYLRGYRSRIEQAHVLVEVVP